MRNLASPSETVYIIVIIHYFPCNFKHYVGKNNTMEQNMLLSLNTAVMLHFHNLFSLFRTLYRTNVLNVP